MGSNVSEVQVRHRCANAMLASNWRPTTPAVMWTSVWWVTVAATTFVPISPGPSTASARAASPWPHTAAKMSTNASSTTDTGHVRQESHHFILIYVFVQIIFFFDFAKSLSFFVFFFFDRSKRSAGFYQPRSGMVMQNCRSKKKKRDLWILVNWSFIICLELFFAKHEYF